MMNLPTAISPYQDPGDIHEYLIRLGLDAKTLTNAATIAIFPTNTTNRVHLRQKLKELGRSRVSKALLDPEPARPTKLNPDANIIRQRGMLRPSRPVIFLTDTSREAYESQVDEINSEPRKSAPLPQQGIGNRLRIFSQPISIVALQPLMAPFVPDILRLLVIKIEEYCNANSWRAIFDTLNEYYEEARYAMVRLIRQAHKPKYVSKVIQSLPHPVCVMTVRVFLFELNMKPLHVPRSYMPYLTACPLFDLFLRPQPGVLETVRRITLSSATSQVDTFAFMMMHLIHAWEAAPKPISGKLQLANLYGRLLISFATKPDLIGRDFSEPKTVESAIFEVLLESADYHFWNQLTMLKIRAAFDSFETGHVSLTRKYSSYTGGHERASLATDIASCDESVITNASLDLRNTAVDRVRSFYDVRNLRIDSKNSSELELSRHSDASSEKSFQ